jgi:hypothetical protein
MFDGLSVIPATGNGTITIRKGHEGHEDRTFAQEDAEVAEGKRFTGAGME